MSEDRVGMPRPTRRSLQQRRTGSISACRCLSHAWVWAVWHFGQLRLPQECQENISVSHCSQRQTWPPSAAVRQSRMSAMAR